MSKNTDLIIPNIMDNILILNDEIGTGIKKKNKSLYIKS